jgi:hypothetical protein
MRHRSDPERIVTGNASVPMVGQDLLAATIKRDAHTARGDDSIGLGAAASFGP